MTHENTFDFSRLTDEQLREAFFNLSKERGERLEQEIQAVKALIKTLLEHFPKMTERDILIRALESEQTMPTEADVQRQLEELREQRRIQNMVVIQK